MTPDNRGSERSYAAIAILGSTLALASLTLPWISADAIGVSSSYPGLDFAAATVPTVLLALGVIGCAIARLYLRDERFLTYAALAAGILLAITAVLLVVIEATSALIPSSLLPATLRRSLVTISAGPGLWTAFGSSIVALVAMIGRRSRQLDLPALARPENRGKLAACLVLGVLVIAIGWLRYRAWLDSSVLDHRLDLPGQAIPWLGPLSLLALWVLVGALPLAVLSHTQTAGLVAAGAGWLFTFLAAIVVIASESLARLRLDELAENSAGIHGVTFHAAPAAWATFFLGLIAAAVGAYLVSWPPRSGGR